MNQIEEIPIVIINPHNKLRVKVEGIYLILLPLSWEDWTSNES